MRGDTLHRGRCAKVIYLAELARAFLCRSVRRKLDTRGGYTRDAHDDRSRRESLVDRALEISSLNIKG